MQLDCAQKAHAVECELTSRLLCSQQQQKAILSTTILLSFISFVPLYSADIQTSCKPQACVLLVYCRLVVANKAVAPFTPILLTGRRLEIESQEQALDRLEKSVQEMTRKAHEAEQKAKTAQETLQVCACHMLQPTSTPLVAALFMWSCESAEYYNKRCKQMVYISSSVLASAVPSQHHQHDLKCSFGILGEGSNAEVCGRRSGPCEGPF